MQTPVQASFAMHDFRRCDAHDLDRARRVVGAYFELRDELFNVVVHRRRAVQDQAVRAVVDAAAVLNLHAVQLHGNEDADYVSALRRELPGPLEIWTAASVGQDLLISCGGDRLLFDNGKGGTGRGFNASSS